MAARGLRGLLQRAAPLRLRLRGAAAAPAAPAGGCPALGGAGQPRRPFLHRAGPLGNKRKEYSERRIIGPDPAAIPVPIAALSPFLIPLPFPLPSTPRLHSHPCSVPTSIPALSPLLIPLSAPFPSLSSLPAPLPPLLRVPAPSPPARAGAGAGRSGPRGQLLHAGDVRRGGQRGGLRALRALVPALAGGGAARGAPAGAARGRLPARARALHLRGDARAAAPRQGRVHRRAPLQPPGEQLALQPRPARLPPHQHRGLLDLLRVPLAAALPAGRRLLRRGGQADGGRLRAPRRPDLRARDAHPAGAHAARGAPDVSAARPRAGTAGSAASPAPGASGSAAHPTPGASRAPGAPPIPRWDSRELHPAPRRHYRERRQPRAGGIRERRPAHSGGILCIPGTRSATQPRTGGIWECRPSRSGITGSAARPRAGTTGSAARPHSGITGSAARPHSAALGAP